MCIRIEDELCRYTIIEMGVKCVFFPDLFNFYSKIILRKLDTLDTLDTLLAFILEREHNLNIIRFAEYTVLKISREGKLKDLLDKRVK